MGPMSQVIERNKSFALCPRFQFTFWCLATMAFLSTVLTLSCGGGTATSATVPSAQVIQVSLSPQTAQVGLGGQIQFSAAVSGSSAGVSWSVSGVAGGSRDRRND